MRVQFHARKDEDILFGRLLGDGLILAVVEQVVIGNARDTDFLSDKPFNKCLTKLVLTEAAVGIAPLLTQVPA